MTSSINFFCQGDTLWKVSRPQHVSKTEKLRSRFKMSGNWSAKSDHVLKLVTCACAEATEGCGLDQKAF